MAGLGQGVGARARPAAGVCGVRCGGPPRPAWQGKCVGLLVKRRAWGSGFALWQKNTHPP